ncbi:MAG TPA: phage major capsid protein [Magnetospirillum sp.]|nr:phage major capsid protein [Magnetospirillum sp.]
MKTFDTPWGPMSALKLAAIAVLAVLAAWSLADSAAMAHPLLIGSIMPAAIAELQQRRARLLDSMDKLAKGEQTDETRAEFDKLEDGVTALDEDIRRARRNDELQRSRAAQQGDVIFGGGTRGAGPEQPPATRSVSVIGTDGDAVRALTRSQSVRDMFTRSGAGGDEDLSSGRFFRGIVTGDWKGAEQEQRAMAVGALATGGYAVPWTIAADLIDVARNHARVVQAGALTIGMDANTMRIVRILTEPTPGWKVENEAMVEGVVTFEPVEMKARTLAVLIKMSRELFKDAKNVQSAVNNALGAGIALELDRVALFGSGVGEEPKGLLNTTGIQTVTVDENGHVLTSYDQFSIAVQQVADVNGAANAVIYSPRTAGTLDRLKDTTGQPLQAPESFKGLLKLSTKQVPDNMTHGTATNASSAVVGEWNNLLVGIREDMEIEMSLGAGDSFQRNQVWMRAILRADIAVARPNKFCVIPGIIPAP